MIGLIKKDLIVSIKNLKPLYFLVMLCAVIPLSQNSIVFVIPIVSMMISLFFTMQATTTLHYDIQAKWDKYAVALPVTRETIVGSKYLLTFILIGFSSVFTALIYIVFWFLNKQIAFKEIITSLLFSISLSLLYISIMIPATYKYGPEGSKFILISFFLLPAIIPIVLRFFNVELTTLDYQGLYDIVKFLPLFVLFVTYISFLISTRIYRNKEF